MKDRVIKALKEKNDPMLIRLIIELYINHDIAEGFDDLVYDLFDYTITYFEQGKIEEFMYLSETVSTLAKKVATVKSTRLYYELSSATSYIMNDHEHTRSILIEYVSFCRANKFDKYVHLILGNIATLELDLKNYSAAKETLKDVYHAADSKPTAVYYVDKARLLLEQGIIEDALACLDTAIVRPEIENSYANKIEIYVLYATYYVLKCDHQTALEWYKDTIELIEQHQLTFEQREVYKKLASILSSLGMFEESNLYLNKYISLVEQVVKSDRALLASKAKLQIFINEKELENLHLMQKNEDIRLENNLDFLTGIYNRRFITKFTNNLLKGQQNFCVLLFDIDHFKKINDVYGHQTGDFILRELSDLLLRLKGENQEIARIGGDEFVIIFRDMDKIEAMSYADQYRVLLAEYVFLYEDHDIKVTISGGIGDLSDQSTFDELLKEADICLYKSKKNGKNQIN